MIDICSAWPASSLHPRHRVSAVLEPARDPPSRGRRRFRAAGGHCRPRSSARAGAGPVIEAMSRGVCQPARLCRPGHRLPVRPPAADELGADISPSPALAGDHLLRVPGCDPLPSRHHAADRPLGRRRDRLGDRDQPGRDRWFAAANIFVGQSDRPLVVRPYLASAAPPSQLFTRDDRRHGRRRRHHPCRLCQPCSARSLLPYLLAAAFMSAPGGILMAKIIMPDEPQPRAAARSTARPSRSSSRSRSPRPSRRRAAGQHHHGRRAGRADRRQAGGRGRRDGARLRRAGARSPTACSAASATGSVSSGLTFQRLVG